VDAANREIAALRHEYEQHKITRAQMEADEEAYTRLMVDLSKERAEADREAAENSIKSMGAEIGTFVGAIAGRKAEAEVEGAFMLAEGAFDVARAIWPPNPALAARGLGEIGAGLNMLKAAGRSGGTETTARGGAGVGGGYGSERESYGSESRGREEYPPQELAPGSAGGGGRFGGLHVVVVGEAEAGNWLANTLNAAVERGVTLHATSAARGAAVGH
jgi:hypothetical protein